jgi:Flp pilus assembly protein TadG
MISMKTGLTERFAKIISVCFAGATERHLAPRAERPRGRRRPLATLFGARDGTSAVEFAVSAPILLGLLVPVADLGIAYAQRQQVQQAVQAGAQYASFHPWNSNSPTAIANAVSSASTLSNISISPSPYQVCGCPNGSAITSTTCGSTCSNGQTAGYYVVVSAQLPYTPVLPYSTLADQVTLTGQSTVRIR